MFWPAAIGRFLAAVAMPYEADGKIATRSVTSPHQCGESLAQAVASREEFFAEKGRRGALAPDPRHAGRLDRLRQRRHVGAIEEVGSFVQPKLALLTDER